MGEFNFNLNDQSPIILPSSDIQTLLKTENNYGNVKVLDSKDITDKSKATGHPIFMPLQFDAVSYEDEEGGTVSLDGLYIPCAILEFTPTKNIVKTAVASSKFSGTVKEHIGLGDIQVSIKGMLIGEGTLYPEDDVKKLYQYFKCPKQIGITHDICAMLHIYDIVIENMQLTNKQGFQNVQPFTISAVSDNPVMLQIGKG